MAQTNLKGVNLLFQVEMWDCHSVDTVTRVQSSGSKFEPGLGKAAVT